MLYRYFITIKHSLSLRWVIVKEVQNILILIYDLVSFPSYFDLGIDFYKLQFKRVQSNIKQP